MHDVNMLINNEDIAASNGKTFERRNPLSGEVASRGAAATVADARAAADAAAAAFPAWSSTGPKERRAKLLHAAELFDARAPEAMQRVQAELGMTAPWGGFNAMLAGNMLREAAALTTQISGEVIPSDNPMIAMGLRQPAGVVLGIAPWNAPLILGVRAIAVPLACGNTVILKGSEQCPATHRLIAEVFRDAGFPPGVVNFVTNAPADAAEIVETLIAHPAVKRINFTGSTRVGRVIAQVCAKYLKRPVLELGGKAPFIVLEDADIDAAVQAAAFSGFMNQGQICMSAERLIVHESIADEFVEKLAAKTKSLSVGDPRKGNVAIGSLVSPEAADRIGGLVGEAVKRGAKLVAGGTTDGTVMSPTVLDRVTPEMQVYTEETFGPVLAVIRVKNEAEALKVANDTEYGLAAAVHSRDIGRAFNFAKKVESGMCHINGPTVQDEAQMPFGGVKASGYGRFGGKAGIDEFTELRWITIETGHRHYPF